MPNAINYAKTYSQTLANAFPYVLHFGALYATPNNGRYRFSGGKTIELPVIKTGARTNADRDAFQVPARNYENEWESKELTRQRQWSTLIHPQDVDQTDMALTITNITSTFNNEHKFPEMDAYCVSKIYADWTALGEEPRSALLSTGNVLTHFDAMMQQMTERGVPVNGRYLYVTPSAMTILKSVSSLNRNMNLFREAGDVTRVIHSLDGVTVVEVPSMLMKTAYTFGNGYQMASDAKQIQMMLIHPESVITPVSYEFAQLDEPSAVTGGKYVYYEESFEDVFLLSKRAAGVDFIVAE